MTAASDWGGPAERLRVRPALVGSHEAQLHELALETGLEPAGRNLLVLTQEAGDETRAVEPLERTADWDRGHPDTFPTGI